MIAQRWGLASPLFLCCALLVTSGILYARLVPEAPRSLRSSEDASDGAPPLLRTRMAPAELLEVRGFVTAIVLNFAYLWIVVGVYDTLVPLFGREGLGLSTAAIGAALAVAVATELVVLYPAGLAADRAGRKAVLVPSLAALLIAVMSLGWAFSFAMFAVLMGFLGIASGVAGVPPRSSPVRRRPQGEVGHRRGRVPLLW
ncbi:hypothetical protein BH24ACT26_BH24ACT26_06990 [soil metagenome]